MRLQILTPTDFSENAWRAIQYAQELYRNRECDFHVLNVFTATSNILDSLLNMEPGSELFEMSKARSEKGLNEIIDKLMLSERGNPNHHFKSISLFNNIIEGIKTVVKKKDIEIIVMGTKGSTASSKSHFGSTAVYVMEKVRNCAVIVVPEAAKMRRPKEIVFPTDFNMYYKRRELQPLIDIARSCGASISILYVASDDTLSTHQEEQKKRLSRYFNTIPHQFHTLDYDDVEPAVNMFVDSRDSDMVAFINKKHPFFSSILSNAMVKDITFHSKDPLLILHDLKN